MNIFGFTPSPLRAAGIAALVAARQRGGNDGVGLVVTANIDHIARLRRDAEFADAYAMATIVTCDGFPVYHYARLRGCAAPERVTGCDILAWLMRHARLGPQVRLFFLADRQDTADALHGWARLRGLVGVAIAVAPERFAERPEAQRAIAQAIRAFGTTILVMGIGAPRSEVFVHRHRHLLPPCWALCVGQAVRVEMGLLPRAPLWWQKWNLEWLWRLGLEPHRMAGRYASAVVGFAQAVLEDVSPSLRRGALSRILLSALLGWLVI